MQAGHTTRQTKIKGRWATPCFRPSLPLPVPYPFCCAQQELNTASNFRRLSSKSNPSILRPFSANIHHSKDLHHTMPSHISLLGLLLALPVHSLAGPLAYGVCQAGCSAVVMACYGAAGATWGATMGATAPASVLAGNSAYGACQAACAACVVMPTP